MIHSLVWRVFELPQQLQAFGVEGVLSYVRRRQVELPPRLVHGEFGRPFDGR